MSYVEDISNALIVTLDHTSGLSVHQLRGHAANARFWIDEAVHCLAVLDGYRQRFEAMKSHERRHRCEAKLTESSPDHVRKELRRRIVEAGDRFLNRCAREQLLTEDGLRELDQLLHAHASVG